MEEVRGQKRGTGTTERADAVAALCCGGILCAEDPQAEAEGRNGRRKDTDLRSEGSFGIWVWLLGPLLQFKLSNCFHNQTCLQQGFAPSQRWRAALCRRGSHAT